MITCPELEFFILSTVFDCRRSLAILESEGLGQIVNRSVPTFTREQLVDTLSRLFRGGEMEARRVKGSRWSQPFAPSLDEIDAALCGALDLNYGLTAEGGARWESMSQYDWSYYFGGWSEEGFEGFAQEMVEVYLSWDKRAIPGSERWKAINPWKATYWKWLPRGGRVTFQKATFSKEPQAMRGAPDDLWLAGWNQARHPLLRAFIPGRAPFVSDLPDQPWRVRHKAVRFRPARQLLQLLQHKDPAVQYSAASTLASAGDLSMLDALIKWLLKTRTRFALLAVSSIDDPALLDALIQIFEHESWQNRPLNRTFRRDLKAAIARYGERALPPLVPMLKSRLVQVQVAAVETLAQTGMAKAADTIFDWLPAINEDNSSDHDLVIRAGLFGLAKLKDARALPLLSDSLKTHPEWGIEALTYFNEPKAWELLEDFAQSEGSIFDRQAALTALAKWNPRYRERLEHVRREARFVRLRRQALDVFGGRANLSGELLSRLHDVDSDRRALAVSLIAQLEIEVPIARLVELLGDRVPRVRANAVYALGLTGSIGAIPFVKALTVDPSGIVRYCALEALKRLSPDTPATSEVI